MRKRRSLKQQWISSLSTFFDIQSSKAKQYGFCMDLGDGKKLTCCGDEPYEDCEESYARNSDWLLHEAFCLYSERELFDPYEKHHSTVKDACELAEKLNIKNLRNFITVQRVEHNYIIDSVYKFRA